MKVLIQFDSPAERDLFGSADGDSLFFAARGETFWLRHEFEDVFDLTEQRMKKRVKLTRLELTFTQGRFVPFDRDIPSETPALRSAKKQLPAARSRKRK
jgi:hypothetical protein